MNKVILTGNLCQDIDVKTTSNETKVIQNTVAVKRDRKEADGTYATDFINIVVWDKQAEYLEAYGHKGDRVELVGRWLVRKFQRKDGTEGVANECIVENISVYQTKKTTDEAAPTPKSPVAAAKNVQDLDVAADDLPF